MNIFDHSLTYFLPKLLIFRRFFIKTSPICLENWWKRPNFDQQLIKCSCLRFFSLLGQSYPCWSENNLQTESSYSSFLVYVRIVDRKFERFIEIYHDMDPMVLIPLTFWNYKNSKVAKIKNLNFLAVISRQAIFQ